jgi:WD40 repeat protein
LTAGLLVTLAPTASAEDSMTDLGVFAYGGDLVVGGDKVVVSIDDRIVVADRAGEVQGTITGVSGASGLAMTADGTRVYAALRGSKEVAEIDTATREITRRIDLAAYGCPFSLALTGERLWVGYGCDATGVLGFDLSAPTSQPAVADTSLLKASPYIAAAGDTLVVGEFSGSPADLFVYDVSGAAPVLRGEIDGHTNYNAGLEDIAVTPDGSHIISAFRLPDAFTMWDATTLAQVRDYEKGPEAEGYPSSVAVSPDGAYIAGGRTSGVGMTLYDSASGTEVYATTPPQGEVVSGSTAYVGRDVYSLVKSDTDHLYLWRIHDATLPASTLTLTAEPGGTAQRPFTMTGQLTFADEPAPGAQPLIVTRTLADGTTATLPSATTAADGTFSITDTPPTGGQTTYTVLWNGDGEHRWSKASVTMEVRYQAVITLTGPTSAIAGTTLVFSGTLQADGTTPPRGGSITVRRSLNVDGGDTVEWRARVSDFGSYRFIDTPEAGEYTYTVRWAGDARTGPAEASQVVTVEKPNA